MVCSILWNSSALAQDTRPHVVDPAALHQAIARQTATDKDNRGVVTALLQKPQVRELANRLGLNVTTAENAVATLDGAELERLAGAARTADAQLAGGADPIVISVTTLLLIIIIVILVAN